MLLQFDDNCGSCQSVQGKISLTNAPRILETTHWLIEHVHPTSIQGWLVLVPPDYPSQLPYATGSDASVDGCNDEGTVCTLTERSCAENGQCRERSLECSDEPCEVVDTWGNAELEGEVMTQSLPAPDCIGSSCYYVNQRCDSDNCNAVVN